MYQSQRKLVEKRLARELAAVGVTPVAAPVLREKVNSTLVAKLISLLKSERGATYAEAAEILKIVPKGDRPHQTPAAQVRALVRDKVRPAHAVIGIDHDRNRGGAVYRLQMAA